MNFSYRRSVQGLEQFLSRFDLPPFAIFLISAVTVLAACTSFPRPPLSTSPSAPSTSTSSSSSSYPGGYCRDGNLAITRHGELVSAVIDRNDLVAAEQILKKHIEDAKCDPWLGGGTAIFIYQLDGKEYSRDLSDEIEISRRMPPGRRSCLISAYTDYLGANIGPTVGFWEMVIDSVCYPSAVQVSLTLDFGGDYIEDPMNRGQSVYSLGPAVYNAPVGFLVLSRTTYQARATSAYRFVAGRITLSGNFVPNPGGSFSTPPASKPPLRVVNAHGHQYPIWSGGPGRQDEVAWPSTPYGGRRGRVINFSQLCQQFYQQNNWTYAPQPQTQPGFYNDHHVKPLRWGGRHRGSNCYRLPKTVHRWFTNFWLVPRFRTPTHQ